VPKKEDYINWIYLIKKKIKTVDEISKMKNSTLFSKVNIKKSRAVVFN
jgi:hypothetical protein